eukprot:1302355-Amphidinium_carterae.1
MWRTEPYHLQVCHSLAQQVDLGSYCPQPCSLKTPTQNANDPGMGLRLNARLRSVALQDATYDMRTLKNSGSNKFLA